MSVTQITILDKSNTMYKQTNDVCRPTLLGNFNLRRSRYLVLFTVSGSVMTENINNNLPVRFNYSTR